MLLFFSSGFIKLNKLKLLINKIGIVLGSGLNDFEHELDTPKILLEDKRTFHKLKILSGKIDNKSIIIFSGRRHFYEGYSAQDVLQNIKFAKELGINLMIITNAAGGINDNFQVSDLMLITSHLNFLNKKISSKNNSVLYDSNTSTWIKNIAMKEKINLKYGSYCCTTGPIYETKSEVRLLIKYGIDAVGMSTVPEIIYANNLSMRTIAFSCITNILSENSIQVTNHEDVVKAGKKAFPNFSRLLKKIISDSSEIIYV